MTEKLRVLAISHEPPDLILGGMGRHVRELYRYMAQLPGVEVDVLTSGPGEGDRMLDGFGYRNSDKLVCWKPGRPGIGSLLMCDLQMTKTLTKLLTDGHRWDIIHGHEWGALQVAWIARHALQVPLVMTMHLCLTEIVSGAGSQAKKRSEEKIHYDTLYGLNQEARMCESDEVILCSDAYRKMVSRTFGERQYRVVPNGIDTERWNPHRGNRMRAMQKHDLRPDRLCALFVGRIAEMKGIETILDLLEAHDVGYQVVVAGEVNAHTKAAKEGWKVTKRLRKLERAHPERLRWIGFQTVQDLLDVYAAADVGLMPSLHEPFGIVALEFMAMGVPLICTEVDGLGEIVTDGKDEFAMIIKRDSTVELSEALAQLRDPVKRWELHTLGLERVKRYAWPEIAAQTVEIYKEAMSRRGSMCSI